MEIDINKMKKHLKKYMCKNNVSILAGEGTSYHLGVPVGDEIAIKLKADFEEEIKLYLYEFNEISYQKLYSAFIAEKMIMQNKGDDLEKIEQAIKKLKRWVINNGDIFNTKIREEYKNDKQLMNNRYYYHEALINKLLIRSPYKRRLNLFTTNYDMAFDFALDNIGVNYITSFTGIHRRYFYPDLYKCDFHFAINDKNSNFNRPQNVIKYYKLHGSLSWVYSGDDLNSNNQYGVRERLMYNGMSYDMREKKVIYPFDFAKALEPQLPYYQLFKLFSEEITQPESVLLCIGYTFDDENINKALIQALHNCSFKLFIINCSQNIRNKQILKSIIELGDDRVCILSSESGDYTELCNIIDMFPEEESDNEENRAIVKVEKKQSKRLSKMEKIEKEIEFIRNQR